MEVVFIYKWYVIAGFTVLIYYRNNY